MDIRLNGIFKDNMVFQWGAELRIFGAAVLPTGATVDPAAEISCSVMSGSTVVTSAVGRFEVDGSFLVCLPAVEEPGGPFDIKITSGSFEKILTNTWAGEVWFAAGQSNMEYPLVRSEFAKYIIPKIPETDIFYYEVPKFGFINDEQMAAEDASAWVRIDASTAGQMSAVAYYFAREVESRIDAKIGIIGCFYGGSTIDCWQSVDNLLSTYEGTRYLKDFDEACSELTEDEYQMRLAEYEAKSERYSEKLSAALAVNPYMTYKEADTEFGEAPWPPPVGRDAIRHPGAFFDSMVLRVAPFTIRGVIFYQGESDCEEHSQEYGKVFASLIREWREVFFDPQMPFVFCQLPMYISKERKYMDYDDMSWPIVREQQQLVAIDVPNVYMAVIVDCGEFDNLHPSDKKTVGDRLALLAEKFVYGFDNVDAVAPYIIDVRRGEGVEITFGGDYLLLNLTVSYSADESGFEVAGEDGTFFPAEASIDFDGRTVLLSCPHVIYPSKARYAYCSYGPTPLHAQNGLTAAPFQANIDKDLGGV